MRTKKDIGKALGRVPSGLFVLTAKCEDREDAVLASWVNQCSF
ncbi:MAG: flavin reductase, partial [Nitrospinaceae bacterium]|nr:flavin reductase [Nitrospinaceae bacterium]NIR57976.1 flavin reductase [Nitrospinaceae bacterium]NIS88439.1 flavin reductase [Nitrospinaceae bacterium]NIT85314.1 flavin reductase [Nitrospinaceae bacterium]NIU47470.1 flavin reductase [Nitrospinaceae bacterium]